MTSTSAPPTVAEKAGLSLLARAELVGRESAGPAAAAVDREGRFPHEAVDALRTHKLLNCAVPVDQGGEGASLGELCAVARILGRYCASTAMIFAMHQTQILSLVHHSTPGVATFVAEAVANDYLIASATTELGTGGDVRSSVCAVARDGDTVTLTKNAPVISYGEYADAILVTARRTADSPPSDQVLVVCRRDDVTLEPTGSWDTLGLRGTCSPGFVLTATTSADLVVGTAYAEISSRTMLPVSHSVWSAVWLGIADAALEKARSFVRSAARRSPGVTPPGALRLAEAAAVHQQFSDLVAASAARFDAAASAQEESMSGMGFSLAMNNLKVTASTLVVDLVNRAMLICGIAGYREDSQYSLGRHLRDAHGAAVMVNNDRIMNNSAQLSIAYRGTL
ncbi:MULTISPECIES: acyl-CoA dehydrogenase family protein [Rhodococcus]|uniref:Acyl-CoA dehydrogenase domain-containing protein n=1 Tax=Rhodococcus pyridinivorans AK37 TaxID=1114960 RepID=H0JU12_9NOCA|nr:MULTISPECIES: acyl-CoA dehydrogenase family protein [Rhodococcus]AWZ22905.1 acyl-CoA dehydrogenase [Rhodococcus pyridinivorans]EHK82422.1 acyl-CoA dehydrogenase domain-containing protein [Rhodococcus pyridinivorans AK37]KHJ73975.1 acyl-CoA dehydrogenase [Rhodococcus sp. Chr-9]MCD2142979.1 acyl-CoA/acyl-ACP dehydrogenase [Rhodococcus pyridinivorans]QQM52902.1 acyl-CoA/acyl-ACP dehydrogenase [Rhodococcus pyridinivorans]